MKKLIPLSIIGIMVLSGLGAIAQPANQNTPEKVTLRFSEPTFQNEINYVSVTMFEANSFVMQQGKPMLPSFSKTFTFPFGTKITKVTVTPQDIHRQTISKHVQPTPQYEVVGQTDSIKTTEPLSYGVETYPSSWFDYSVGCGRTDAGLSIIVDVQVYPVRYHPNEKVIEWASQADVVVEYEPAAPQPSPRENYQLVVIGPAEYSGQIAPLITHKIGRGIPSKFVSLEEIYGATYFPVTGRDNPEKIKYFIKNTIESWSTGNILLVGGSSKLPIRETHIYIDDGPYGDEIFASDLYYADIYNATGAFSSWDTNANNIFGEYNWQGQTDKVDLHPDVYLARLPATNAGQVTNCVNKIMTYENVPGYQQNWFTTFIVCGGDSFEDTKEIDEGEYANQKAIDVMDGFAANKLWVTNGELTGYAPTGVAVIKSAINDGCGFVDFSGHGNTNVWATHPHLNFGVWVPTPTMGILTSDVSSLTNGDKLPIITVEACSTAKYAEDPNCFNWAAVYNANGGAIAAFGASAIGLGYGGTYTISKGISKIGLETYKAYKTDQSTTFGEMWSKALNRYIKSGMDAIDYKTVEEWQAFGDPTLAIGEKSQAPAKPQTPTGQVNGSINTDYTYTSSSTDPDGDKISYMFDWGDGTFSSWIGPQNSGTPVSAPKSWPTKGTYQIKVVAKDTHGVLSDWSDPLTVTMPVKKDFPGYSFLEWLFERFPHAFPILRHLLGF
jgi:hypothetical protein